MSATTHDAQPALSPPERVRLAYRSIARVDRPEVWIHLREERDVLVDARMIEQRQAEGEALPLAGALLAVKDNIDVAGLETTAGCPSFASRAPADAPAVARLRAAGAIVLGKTNLDQFATGLAGTRSPYGAVRDARDKTRVSGGSSSGSAVAVALGIADLALGTDTAGSGRVPAAFQGIVGVKPTRGLVSMRGVVPACRSFDCVSVFARTVAEGAAAVAALSGADPLDPAARAWSLDAPVAAPPAPRVGVARLDQLQLLSSDGRRALAAAVAELCASGASVVEVDIEPLLQAGSMLYGGAFIAERYAAVGEFIAEDHDDIDPTVAKIILAAKSISAAQYIADRERLDEHRLAARQLLAGLDALLLPTAPDQPTIRDVAADPLEANRRLGTYTTFCNVLDLCAIAIPAGEADGRCFGVTLFAPAFHDRVVSDLASRLMGSGCATPAGVGLAAPAIALLVVGAHMSGGPLNRQLTAQGARLIRPVQTASCYKLYRLATVPPKPGLVRVEPSDRPGPDSASIEGELWALPPAGLASLLAALPKPMTLGSVTLKDGSEVVGFLCEPAALQRDAQDITAHRGWRAYLAAGGESHSS